MSTIFSCVILYAFLILSAWRDVKYGEIPAAAAIAAFAGGILAACIEGWPAGLAYLLRFLLFAAPFFLLFLLGVTGGGDWKLFGLVGALGGWSFGVYAEGIALLLAGVCAVIRLSRNGRIRVRFRILVRYCKRCMLDHVLYRYPAVRDSADELRLGVFVLLGAVLTHFYMLWNLIVSH